MYIEAHRSLVTILEMKSNSGIFLIFYPLVSLKNLYVNFPRRSYRTTRHLLVFHTALDVVLLGPQPLPC